MNRDGFVVWFTGLSGAGKTTLSLDLFSRLKDAGCRAELLDGDVVRQGLSKDLGFTREDRNEHVRRLGFLCGLLARNGIVTIVAAISPYREAREELKRTIPNFVEIFVDCPVSVLAERDVKGLYRKALAGEIANFTGISDPYEPPGDPAVTIHSDREAIAESCEKIWRELEHRGLVNAPAATVVGRG